MVIRGDMMREKKLSVKSGPFQIDLSLYILKSYDPDETVIEINGYDFTDLSSFLL